MTLDKCDILRDQERPCSRCGLPVLANEEKYIIDNDWIHMECWDKFKEMIKIACKEKPQDGERRVEGMKYRKKFIIVDPKRWFKNGDDPDVTPYKITEGGTCQECGAALSARSHGWIYTKEGGHIVCPGDWILVGAKGEKYPCKPDIFEATYEGVEG